MSDVNTVPHNVLIDRWVDEGKADRIRHRERQVTAILLHAIGMTPILRQSLVLKGGILMSLVHGSHRQTGDVDFTAIVDPSPYAEQLKEILDGALRRAATDLGYLDLVLAVQRFAYRPKPEGFADMQAPSLEVSIGYADRGSSDERRLADRRSTRVLQVDISFKEPVLHAAAVVLEETDVSIQTYTVDEIIAEKFRAMLQQVTRNRIRRQDAFDIHWLIHRYRPDQSMQEAILRALLKKSDERELQPTRASLDDPEVRRRSGAEWESLRLEIGAPPEFEALFDEVAEFYRALPWPAD